jgi:hypothetical protein
MSRAGPAGPLPTPRRFLQARIDTHMFRRFRCDVTKTNRLQDRRRYKHYFVRANTKHTGAGTFRTSPVGVSAPVA